MVRFHHGFIRPQVDPTIEMHVGVLVALDSLAELVVADRRQHRRNAIKKAPVHHKAIRPGRRQTPSSTPGKVLRVGGEPMDVVGRLVKATPRISRQHRRQTSITEVTRQRRQKRLAPLVEVELAVVPGR